MTPRMTTSFHPYLDRLAGITRQQFVRSTSLGLGAAALNSLLNSSATADQTLVDPFAPRRSHFPARVKNVILLSMSGGPSHLDLFDYKPELLRRNGEECPQSLMEGKPFAFTGSTARLLGTPQRFQQFGESGAWMSAAIPHLSTIADELTFIKSLYTEQFNHGPAELLLYTGIPRTAGRPSLGSWITYGLGSENRNLPGFIVFVSGGSLPSGGKAGWGSGFLPSVYQGVRREIRCCTSPTPKAWTVSCDASA